MKPIRHLIAGLALAFAFLAAPAAHAGGVYDNYLDKVFAGTVIKTDTYKCALVTSAYTQNKGTHQYFSDITNEVTGTGYTAGGVTVVPTYALNTSAHTYTITFPAMSWTSSTITARGTVCYKSTGTASTSPLVVYSSFGASDVSSTGGTFATTAFTYTINIP